MQTVSPVSCVRSRSRCPESRSSATRGSWRPAAILVALVAVVMTRAHRTLAAAAVAVATAAFFFGMVVAVLTDSALY